MSIEQAPRHMTPEEQDALAERLVGAIQARKLRPSEIAAHLGITESAVRNWMGGAYRVSYPYQQKLSELLDSIV